MNALATSADGHLIAAAGHDGLLRLWEVQTGRSIGELAHDGPVQRATFSPKGHFLVTASGSGSETLTLWDGNGYKRKRILRQESYNYIQDFAFSPDEKFLAVAMTLGMDGKPIEIFDLRVASVRLPAIISRLPVSGRGVTVTFDRDGKHLFTAGRTDGYVWDNWWGGKPQRRTSFRWSPTPIAAAAANGTLTAIVAGVSGEAPSPYWSGKSGMQGDVRQLLSVTDRVAISPDGQYAAISRWDGSTSATGTLLTIHDLEQHRIGESVRLSGRITQLRFSPEGTNLLAAVDDGTAHLYTFQHDELLLIRLREIARMTHDGPVRDALFVGSASNDGNIVIATASDDKKVRLWGIGGALTPARFRFDESSSGEEAVRAVAFGQDGLLTIAALNGMVRSWHVTDEAVTTLGPARVTTAWGPTISLDGTQLAWDQSGGVSVQNLSFSKGEPGHGNSPDMYRFRKAPPDGNRSVSTTTPGERATGVVAVSQNQGSLAMVWNATSYSATSRFLLGVWQIGNPESVAQWEQTEPISRLALSDPISASSLSQYVFAAPSLPSMSARLWQVDHAQRKLRQITWDDAPVGAKMVGIFVPLHRSIAGREMAPTLITGEENGRLTLWRLRNGDSPIPDIQRQTSAPILAVAANPRLQLVAWAGLDRIIHVALPDLNEVASFSSDLNAAELAFDPGGKYLAAIETYDWNGRWHSGTVRLFPLPQNGAVAHADKESTVRRRVGRNISLEEWKASFPGEPYHKTFPDLP